MYWMIRCFLWNTEACKTSEGKVVIKDFFKSVMGKTIPSLQETALEKEYNLKGRIISAGGDLLRIVATPISLIGLELSAIYGIFNPFDGRKLYASFERATYGKHILAPCFQPDPEKHLFGGDMSQKDAW